MESNLYKFEEEKTIELFQESDFLSTGDRSILKDDLTIALFEKKLINDITGNIASDDNVQVMSAKC